MARVEKKVQSFTSFNAGEYSPSLAGRVDLESFGSSARKISNFLVDTSGGIKKFCGSLHVAEIPKPDNFILVPFINKHEPMSLVLHDGNVGLLASGSYKELNIQIPVVSGYDKLRWKQVNDRVLFVHPTQQPFSIDFYGVSVDGEYLFIPNNIEFDEVPYFPIGFTGDYAGKVVASGITGTVRLSVPDAGTVVSVPFPYPVASASSYLRIDDMFFVRTGSGSEYSSPSPATISLIRIRGGAEEVLATGVASTVYNSQTSGTTTASTSSGYSVVNPRGSSVRPPSTGGTSVTTGTWVTITETVNREQILNVVKTVFSDAKIEDGYIKISVEDDSVLDIDDLLYFKIELGSYYRRDYAGEELTLPSEVHTTQEDLALVSRNSFNNIENIVGRKIKFFMNTTGTIRPWYQSEEIEETGQIRFSNGHYYMATSTGTCGNIQPSHVSGIAGDGGVYWRYIHSGSSTASVLSVDSDTQITVQLSEGSYLPVLQEDERIFDAYSWSIWGYKGVHPSEIYFVQNRLGLICNTDGYGAWDALSVSDNYFDYSTEQYGQTLDTSAIVHIMSDNPDNKIDWVLAYGKVFMGSATTEFTISTKDVITPTTFACPAISSIGGASVRPTKYKELNVFVGSSKEELHTIGYDYTVEAFIPNSLGYNVRHFLDQGISRMEQFGQKDKLLCILHDTGAITAMNYVRDQRVLCYSAIDAGAPVLDVCYSISGSKRNLYLAVERNDGRVSFEYSSEDYPVYMWNTFSYGFEEEQSSFDIPELAGQQVYVLYDNSFIRTTLDEDGHYDFISPVKEYVVGLPMVCELHTQPSFGEKVEGMQQQSISVYLRLYNSGAFSYGASVDFDKYFEYKEWADRQEFGEAPTLFTGDCALNIPLGYAEAANWGDGRYPNTSGVGVNIRCDTPEPFNLLSIQEIYK